MGDSSGLNRGPTFLGVSWFLTLFSGAFLALRLYCKLGRGLRLWWDDWISVAGWIMILANASLTTALVQELHLGTHSSVLSIDDPVELTLTLNSRASVTQTAIVWTKTAFAVTLLRLTEGPTKAFVWFIIISTNIAMAVGAMAIWIQCTPLAKGWDRTLDGTCWGAETVIIIWIAIGAYSAAMDFVLAALPWTFLRKLHMAKREKIGIGVAMSMGILAGIVGIIKCIELPILETGDGFISIGLYMWDMTEETTTLIASSIPTLRVLITSERRHLWGASKLQDVTPTTVTLKMSGNKNTSASRTWLWKTESDEQEMVGSSQKSEGHAV
ncbi:hypothetical protein QBC47DRAFT_306866 [Echria macrotheca]|uniref:Rhodopsin domain-containing protein n=1 Tax=Echria macrotheca TaxID=438768 RepID=A0AAJ0F631_9PEZI|nr:hypothetical protein QBC47DRAFT_306866 [Echria macrotheca]